MPHRAILLLLLAIGSARAGAAALTAKVVRSKKPSERIPGLTLKSKKVTVKKERGETTTYTTQIKITFTTKGRSLLRDESPLVIDPKKAAQKKQELKVDVTLSGRVTPVRLMALGPSGTIEEEKILVVFEKWKKKKKEATPESPAESGDKPAPPPTVAKTETKPREPQALKTGASETAVPAPAASYRLTALVRVTSASRDSVDNATGVTSAVSSPLNFGLGLMGAVAWTKTIEPIVYFDVTRYGYSPASFGSFDTSSSVLLGFGAGAQFYPLGSRTLVASVLLGYQQQAVLRAPSVGAFTFDTLAMPRLTLGTGVQLFDDKRSSIWLNAGVLVDFSSQTPSYTYRNGFGFSARLTGTRWFGTTQLRGTLLYQHETSSTTITDFSQKEYGLELGAAWDF